MIIKAFRLLLFLVLLLTALAGTLGQSTGLPIKPAVSNSGGSSDSIVQTSAPDEKSILNHSADRAGTESAAEGNEAVIADPLVRMLIAKGVLTESEGRSIGTAGSAELQRDRLAALLRDKGIISAVEYEGVRTVVPSTDAAPLNATTVSNTGVAPAPEEHSTPQAAPTPSVIAAVAPVRLLPLDVPKREGLIPDIKLGSGARLKLYGYFKASIIHDTSSPQGNDFPLPLLASDTGPNSSPEFHLKARAFRFGSNFEWLDPAPQTVITGKLEFDFEGNFTRVNNRNISSIRSSQPSIRLAWGRIDRRLSENTTGFMLFGQDWTPFVASTLPNTIENTNFGGIGYGAAYERAPQARFGLNFNLGGSRALRLEPEFAIVFPAFGNLPVNVADQLGFGEREGADSQRPSYQGRVVAQWQLDKAEGVPPAEVIVSFEHARRKAIVTAASVPIAFRSAFPSGAEVSSNSDGYSAEFQLPTRFVTVVGKYYSGSDLRFYFAGQLLSNFNDTAGLTSVATAPSIDASSTVAFGLLDGVPVVAPQRPVRGQGGFIQVGFPLSRLFDADPKGRNSGWSGYLYYGYDQATARDARRFGPHGAKSDLFSGNIQYKLNSLVTFGYEQGYYRTRAADRTNLPLFRGIPSYSTHNIRSEFAAIFNF